MDFECNAMGLDRWTDGVLLCLLQLAAAAKGNVHPSQGARLFH